jgi:hypothetical protein
VSAVEVAANSKSRQLWELAECGDRAAAIP